jgi:streptogramin lyase
MCRIIFFFMLVTCGVAIQAQTPRIIATDSPKDVIPEGICIDPRTGSIFVSSIHQKKIMKIDTLGRTAEFITSNQDGFLEGLGMKVDTVHHLLWAASVQKEGNLHNSKIHAFDVRNARTMHQFVLKDSGNHLLNDLVITQSGNIFITDTYFGAVYRIDETRRGLQLFLKHPMLAYPNGIEDLGNNNLAIATYSNGIVILNSKSQKISRLPGAKDTVIFKGLDGLVRSGERLYGVYNAGKSQKDNAVVEYILNAACDSIVGEKIIDRGNALFHDPTTAAMYKGTLHVIANSYLTEYNQNKASTKGIENQLGSVVLLAYNTNHKHAVIKGVYGHPGDFWKKGYNLRDLNVNSVFLHHKSIDSSFMIRACGEGLKVFAEFATLNGEGYVEQHPEAWAVDASGNKVKKATWFMGVCPTDPKFLNYRLDQLRQLLTTFDIDGVWLDYLHWHAQFEDPEPILPETCFNESCISAFSEYSGVRVQGNTTAEKARFILSKHDKEWRKWRTVVLANWVKQCRNVVKSIKPEALLGVYHCPWNDVEFDSARYRILGIDYGQLSEYADVFSPMVYHKRMGRSPEWVKENIQWFSEKLKNSDARIWPIVQAYNDPGIVSAEEFRQVLLNGLEGSSSGIMMFTSSSVAEDSSKVAAMKSVYAR